MVFRGTWAVGAGLLTPDQLRSSAWRRVRHDVYAHVDQERTHRLYARGTALVMPPGAAFGGRTAADLWGVRGLVGPDDPVEVLLPPGTRWSPAPGVRVRAADLSGDVVRQGPWLRWTDRVRTAVDLARSGAPDPDEVVVLLDRLVHAGMVDLGDVRRAVAALPRCRGSRQAREVVGWADGLAQSPQETRLRLVLQRAGLSSVAQHVVLHRGVFVARVDFAWPEHRLAVEYDGLWHRDPQQFVADRRRLNALLAAGWRVVFVTAADLHRPAGMLVRVHSALAS
ncbi:hypothetical protein GB931_20565 [Modestobacter sp. I12A-02628]|uniref:DUF559 domain-containing protein n=1 Tax=Goekera deserti TaxID=2497753 RepID=A0A7K3W8L8_9ACTN|nr:hypothetical protein [Goekera deserti]MPR00266.1 hypothetical protein [Goekera deserti]NDI49440.1 hypothetical protein [Goekera deserti]NEL52686.1 hypothetical protein [Goekera deserti]